MKRNGGSGEASRPRPIRKPKRPTTYHHGSLRGALLQAAERVLERDGIQKLTLRAAAREAGVSHAAPKHHFGDLTGLLSELAAVGFERRTAMMDASIRRGASPTQRLDAFGHIYVAFARKHPDLFLLMYRGERLDFQRPTLSAAVLESRKRLADAVGAVRKEGVGPIPTLSQAAGRIGAWSLVHGFSMLLLEGRLKGQMSLLPPGTSVETLLDAIFQGFRFGSIAGPVAPTKRQTG